jgi:hypothetical protein
MKSPVRCARRVCRQGVSEREPFTAEFDDLFGRMNRLLESAAACRS